MRREESAGRRRAGMSVGAAAFPLAAALAWGGCSEPGPTAPTPIVTATADSEPERVEFTGEVVESYPDLHGWRGLPGVTVTLTGGRVDGWTTMTDGQGRFTFADYPTCARGSVECRVRSIWVEKPGYETRWESLDDPHRNLHLSERWEWHSDHRQVVMGHVWPPDPQFDRLRRQLPAMDPVWLMLWDADQWPTGQQHGGEYVDGILRVLAGPSKPAWVIGRAVTHEYCHAHQDWVVDPNRYGAFGEWPDTPGGRAFEAAEAADRAAGNWISSRYQSYERAATICEIFYYEIKYPTFPREYEDDRVWLRENAPHQYEWASEWLHAFGGFREPATLRFRRGGR